MIHVLKRAWADMLMPILQRPKRVQVAALCYKNTEDGKKVLLITSRDTGRWILPKGWPVEGKDGPGSALQEAWEEAGVSKADIEEEPMGYYEYAKGLDNGVSVPVETQVYMTRVRDLKKSYPEVDERERQWFSPGEAANLVDEPDLKEILKAL
ncbi:NUDIX domain-containing protein [Sulfitobacter sp. JBTF-M27]|uniref:NUDIX domain-containing protein n=1 Tax=Sulfitobacter sediminilitoris TaxID=2698830 RepID=A0A6P0C864_9RHOB|nr:NUDIX hydrolase [Sulfitobacter sediminilitoris]NEK22332.1 NUDIX domain-containing protein [Sulfitobacter sediminilitoris]